MQVRPTLTRQCWLFAAGSVLFATATAPGIATALGLHLATALCFAGSWFFTTAAWMQLHLAEGGSRRGVQSAAIQLIGTALFNVSTASALWLQNAAERRPLMWTPDAVGSAAFLFSGVLAVAAAAAVNAAARRIAWINLAGCVAFGVSAVAGYVGRSGTPEDQWLDNRGTFVGALCFLTAALMALPRFRKPVPALPESAR